MDDKDNFNYVLMVNNIEFRNFHVFMNHNSNYSLVYLDPSNSIYLKKNSANAEILKKYGDAAWMRNTTFMENWRARLRHFNKQDLLAFLSRKHRCRA